MTWDPTDQQGWKRAMRVSISPSPPAHPEKKRKLDAMPDKDSVILSKENNTANHEAETVQRTLPALRTENCEAVQRPLPALTKENSETQPGEAAPMHSILRPRKHRLISEPPTEARSYEDKAKDYLAPQFSVTRKNASEHDSPQLSPISQRNEVATDGISAFRSPVPASTSVLRAGVDMTSGSSNSAPDMTNNYLPSASPPYLRPPPFPLVVTRLPSIEVGGTLVSSPYASPTPRPAQAAPPLSARQNFGFGNLDGDPRRANNHDYLEKVKQNAYTSALLLPQRRQNIPTPKNSLEARELLARGCYNTPVPDPLPQPGLQELENVLGDLRRRYAKLKAMSTSSGIMDHGDPYKTVSDIVERERPSIKNVFYEYTETRLKDFVEQLERWDKAVGQKAILMKRMLYKEQITQLVKKVEKMRSLGAKKAEDGSAGEMIMGEWKGHKTRLGRRFQGLIEKN